MDDTDPCLDKGRTSVLFSATLIARRKRMEIRRFRKLSRSTSLFNTSLLPVAESSANCIKRARVERAATTGSFTVNGTLPASWHIDEASTNFLCKGKQAASFNGFGLLSCKYLPPGNVHGIYADGASPNGAEEGVLVSMNEGQPCISMPDLSKGQESERKCSSLHVGCDTLCNGTSSRMDVGLEGLQSGKIDALATVELLRGEKLENRSEISDLTVNKVDAEIDDNGICVTKTVISTQSKEHTSLEHPRHYSCPPCGKLLICGRQREMEDTLTIAPSFAQVDCGIAGGCFCQQKVEAQVSCDLHFFAIYDGHGGSQASTYCRKRLHLALAEELSSLHSASEGDLDASEGPSSSTWTKIMETCFLKVDQEVGGMCPNGQCSDLYDGMSTCCADTIAPETVGTTAVVAVVSSCQIVVGNCGDSRAVLSRGGVAIPLSNDHKPEREDETSRIEAAGGRVIFWDGYRVGGLLALSRSIGDRYLKPYVVSEPEVTRVQRTDDDECLILASDGLWDVVDNDMVCEIARKYLDSSRKNRASESFSAIGVDPASAAVAALLVKLAYGRGSKDNISVVVIDLKS